MSAFSTESLLFCFISFSLSDAFRFTHFRYDRFRMAGLKPPQTTASKLRELLANENDIVVCPGVYDGFTARLALNAGFKILYMVCYHYKLYETA
jgi:hypothetical protein